MKMTKAQIIAEFTAEYRKTILFEILEWEQYQAGIGFTPESEQRLAEDCEQFIHDAYEHLEWEGHLDSIVSIHEAVGMFHQSRTNYPSPYRFHGYLHTAADASPRDVFFEDGDEAVTYE